MDALIEPNSSGYNALWRAAAVVVFSQYLRRLADIADKATAFAVVEKSRKYIGKTCITRGLYATIVALSARGVKCISWH